MSNIQLIARTTIQNQCGHTVVERIRLATPSGPVVYVQATDEEDMVETLTFPGRAPVDIMDMRPSDHWWGLMGSVKDFIFEEVWA